MRKAFIHCVNVVVYGTRCGSFPTHPPTRDGDANPRPPLPYLQSSDSSPFQMATIIARTLLLPTAVVKSAFWDSSLNRHSSWSWNMAWLSVPEFRAYDYDACMHPFVTECVGIPTL